MGHTEVVEFLYSRGADLNTVQYGGRTPLLNAAFSKADRGEETALYLLSTGGVTDQGPFSIEKIKCFFLALFGQNRKFALYWSIQNSMRQPIFGSLAYD